jgi:hypothetical protein
MNLVVAFPHECPHADCWWRPECLWWECLDCGARLGGADGREVAQGWTPPIPREVKYKVVPPPLLKP